MHLINIKLDGFDLPDDLPHHLVPPSKKKVYNGNGYSWVKINKLQTVKLCYIMRKRKNLSNQCSFEKTNKAII